jgi:hypothetical protein
MSSKRIPVVLVFVLLAAGVAWWWATTQPPTEVPVSVSPTPPPVSVEADAPPENLPPEPADRPPSREPNVLDSLMTLPSGLRYQIENPGSGVHPTASDTVKVNYTGVLMDGTKFDSSSDHGGPASFPLNQVIPGWTEGLQLIGRGGKIRLVIPADLAYGNRGAGTLVPPGATLLFEIELIDINSR